jgi:cell division protein FtsL
MTTTVRVPVRPRPAPKDEIPPRHLRVVHPDEGRPRRLTPQIGVLITAMIFVALVAVAVSQTLLVQGQLRLDDLDTKLAVEQAEYQQLRLRVADLESPARIVDTAINDLGMVSPADLVYLAPVDAAHPTGAAGPKTKDADTAGDDEWATVKPLLDGPAG